MRMLAVSGASISLEYGKSYYSPEGFYARVLRKESAGLALGTLLIKGSLHRKQKISYETSGRNPKDLDLLDGGSKDEIQSLTLEK